MTTISYINIPGIGITAVIAGKAYCITSDNSSFREVERAIAAGHDDEYIVELFNAANAVKRYMRGEVQVSECGSVLYYGGKEIHGTIADRILAFMRADLPVGPLIAFLKRLKANVSSRSIEELYKFLEKQFLPITEDGCFLGYKAIRGDWTDKYTGQVWNGVGANPKLARAAVDDDARHDCSFGYHVGSLEYATGFASCGDKVVIVKVDPADVVSVPYSDANKLRTTSYTVVCEYAGALGSEFACGADPYKANKLRGYTDHNDHHEDCACPACDEAY
jgi:hypothetical protein